MAIQSSAGKQNPQKLGRIPVYHLGGLVNLVRNHPDIGYISMNREHMDLVNDYDPYRFTICSYNSINKENYATVSSNGVIEFYKGDADFLPLDRLEVERKLFIALKEIPSFATFRLWKAFIIWLKKNRMKRFIEARDKLEMFFATKYSQKAETPF
ncbi:dynein axonemal heavy chain 6-like [Argiope bruennichi]|uniref:dynein axonemal heavy chain 6-like n=1 Tax=Argiope bruennichi TaxID=94029 RepID=UPI002494EF0C|nr:dynein axonemal heavy chain 6-like [Argiope bruennichi]